MGLGRKIVGMLGAAFVVGATTLHTSDVIADEAAPQCGDLRKGDETACKAKVKARCTQKDYWPRRNCEAEIALDSELCRSKAYADACATMEKAAPSCRIAKTTDLESTPIEKLSTWIEAAYRAEALKSSYMAAYNEWHVCDGLSGKMATEAGPRCQRSPNLDGCDKAPQAFRDNYRGTVDGLFKSDLLGKARQNLEALKKGPKDLVMANLEEELSEQTKTAKQLLDLGAKLPKDFAYKRAELEASIRDAAQLSTEYQALKRSWVAQSSCPKGTELQGEFRRLVRASTVNSDTVRSFRQTGPKNVTREGLVVKEFIPVTLCSREKAAAGQNVCTATRSGLLRERPAGGSWTSWQVTVGGASEVNCKSVP